MVRWDRVAAAEHAYTSATRSGRFTGTSIAGTYRPGPPSQPGNTGQGAAA